MINNIFKKAVAVMFTALFFVSSYSQNDTGFVSLNDGVKYRIIEKGRGISPQKGDVVIVHYKAIANDSILFEDTYKKEFSLEFTLGIGQVIQGWELAFPYFHQGDKVQLLISSEYGYGNIESGKIPANANLFFELYILQVIRGNMIKPYDASNLDTLSLENGLKYFVLEKGNDNKMQKGSIITLDYTGFLENGKIFDSSVKRKKPLKFIFGESKILDGWTSSLPLISEGGKMKLIVPPQLAYGEQGFKNIIPKNETLIFDILILEIKPAIEVEPFIAEKEDFIKTKSGLKYAIIKEGTGKIPKKNSIVQVHYSGYFKNGKMFDSSVKRDQPIEFPVGIEAVINGWDEALQLLKEGTKARLIIPAKLAYGSLGNPPTIPPNKKLIFDVELLKVFE